MRALLFDGSAPRLDADHPTPHPPAGEALASGRIDPRDMISATYPLSEGPAALTAAAEPGHIKILLDPRS